VGHVEDALAAAEAGADAIGMIFHPPSKRNLELSQAAKIVAALPPFVTPVGLFVNAEVKQVRQTAQALGLRHIQLHGDEPPEVVAEFEGFVVLKAIRVAPDDFVRELKRWTSAIARLRLIHLKGFVLETANALGGSGKPNDWEMIKRHQQNGDFIGLPPLIAAGGLTPETVGAVVRDLHPWAVDVSSGVEEIAGRKSPRKIEAFVRAVRIADED
jgi:phosphoribosylanthranilate isomerase